MGPAAFSVAIAALCILSGILNARNHATTVPQWPERTQSWLGIVSEEPRQTAKIWRLTMRLDSAGEYRKIQLSILKSAMADAPTVGTALRFSASMKEPHNFVSTDSTANSSFDYATWLRRQGYSGQAFAWQRPDSLSADAAHLILSKLPFLARLQIKALALRHLLTERYRLIGLEDTEHSVLAAMTLGHKSQLTPATRHTFSSTGASHVLALSGLHLGILVSLLMMMLRPLRYRRSTRWAMTLLVAAMVWAFVVLTGCSISIIRAATMLTIMLLASMRGEGFSSLNNLLLAAFIILIISPQSALDVGFQLSFVAVFFILYLSPYYQALKQRLPFRALRPVADFVFISVVAQVATAPIVATTFGQLPMWFLLTNVIVIPSAYVLLCGALLFFALSWWPAAAALIGWVLQSVTHAMLVSLQHIAALPMASVSLSPTALTACLCYPTLFSLIAWLVLRRRHYMFATALLLALIISIEYWLG